MKTYRFEVEVSVADGDEESFQADARLVVQSLNAAFSAAKEQNPAFDVETVTVVGPADPRAGQIWAHLSPQEWHYITVMLPAPPALWCSALARLAFDKLRAQVGG